MSDTDTTAQYELTDGQEMHRLHPDTFWAPSDHDLALLTVGDFVKLGFEYDGEGERMWVLVTQLPTETDPNIHGRLSNQPAAIDGLSHGMEVVFETRHVLNFEEIGLGMGTDA